MSKKSKLQFTEADKQAIRDNQQEMAEILGTSHLADGYELITDNNDYDKLIGIAPIFEKMSDAIEESDNYCCDYELSDEIDELDEEISKFLRDLPAVEINLDLDTFNKQYRADEIYAFREEVVEDLGFDSLLNCLLKSKRLTKEEKEKVISAVCNDFEFVTFCY